MTRFSSPLLLGGDRLLPQVGHPACGKTALFKRLPGSHPRESHCAGFTLDLREDGLFRAPGRVLRMFALAGACRLRPR